MSEIAEEREEALGMVEWEVSWRVSVETSILFQWINQQFRAPTLECM